MLDQVSMQTVSNSEHSYQTLDQVLQKPNTVYSNEMLDQVSMQTVSKSEHYSYASSLSTWLSRYSHKHHMELYPTNAFLICSLVMFQYFVLFWFS